MSRETRVGGSCYTVAESHKLLGRINKQSDVQIKSIRGNWLYYINLKKGLLPDLDKVQQLLQLSGDASSTSNPAPSNGITLYITPRNISPWSSKATSIAQVCGLHQVDRLERGRVITIEFEGSAQDESSFRDLIHDRMTETITTEQPSLDAMFVEGDRTPLVVVDIFIDGQPPLSVLADYNKKMGLALSQDEMQYLVDVYTKLGRPPHDVELFMFAQVNSEYVLHGSLA